MCLPSLNGVARLGFSFREGEVGTRLLATTVASLFVRSRFERDYGDMYISLDLDGGVPKSKVTTDPSWFALGERSWLTVYHTGVNVLAQA
jgi:hypothetical protein